MRTYTTCSTCGTQLAVDNHRRCTHPTCPPSLDPGDVLEAAFLAAVLAGHDTRADQHGTALDAYEQRPPNMLGAALTYAQWGWPVFPCRPGLKRPITEHGLHDASTDTATIRDWWGRTPTANVALATGHAFDVLDVDPAGLAGWADLRASQIDLDVHGVVSTPRGGLHLYLQPSGDGNLAGFLPGHDYRGAGGYVLAPPAVLVPAALKDHPVPPWPLRYTWTTRPSPAIAGQAVVV